jgi:threonine aldolase
MIDLASDTATRPTPQMRRAIAEAPVGDEQRREDPTTSALEARVAELLGHEAAVFLPSGTMCNQIALRLHVSAGEEVLIGRATHPLVAEAGGAAAHAGAVLTTLPGEGGMFTADTLRGAINRTDRYRPRSAAVAVEQPTNVAGGRVWPLPEVLSVLEVAAEHGLKTHLDGARLLNAVVATGVPAADWASRFDTAWLDFSKGLGAPVGACLAGSAALIEEAWRFKQMMGGSLRQSGILAAAALHALDHHVERLAEDHEHARVLAEGLAQLPGVALDPALVETNIVLFEVADAPAFVAGLLERGVRMGALGPRLVRAVTHLDVDRDGIEEALAAARAELGPRPPGR